MTTNPIDLAASARASLEHYFRRTDGGNYGDELNQARTAALISIAESLQALTPTKAPVTDSDPIPEIVGATIARLATVTVAARRVLDEWRAYDPATQPHDPLLARAMLDLSRTLEARR